MRVANYLYYGDNLEVLRDEIPNEYVDLVYLDPPFNSNRSYNVLFQQKSGGDAQAQIEAFDDTWTWSHEAEQQYLDLVSGGAPAKVADAIEAMRKLVGDNDVLAYLVMMTPRLVELHRALKPTGSLYLHCDPTASHYLKIVLDAVFGPTHFRNEVIWKRTGSHNSAKRWGPVHDVLLFYSKSDHYTWNPQYQPYDPAYLEAKFTRSDERGRYQDVSLTGPGTRTGDSGQAWRGIDPTATGRHWQPPTMLYDLYRMLTGEELGQYSLLERLDKADEAGLIHWPKKTGGTPRFKQYAHISPGQLAHDVITDVGALNSQAAERLGYPTQKPVALLERIIKASSNEGDVVLDPFCGCGTTIDAAEKLGRKWVGIDITYLAVDLITKRLRDTHGDEVMGNVEVRGIPRDVPGARALFERSPFDFERWAVSLVNGQPNMKQVGDKGADGVIRFPLDGTGKNIGKVLVSVKGGKAPGPTAVRDLAGTVEAQRGQMGLLVTLEAPTRGMQDAAQHAGTYPWPWNGTVYPKVQIITVPELLAGDVANLPPSLLPYVAAKRQLRPAAEQGGLFDV
jgi:DNA modification methylase